MQGLVLCFLELFANVEEVDLATRHHDADQGPVVRAKALQRKTRTALIQHISVAVSHTTYRTLPSKRAFRVLLHRQESRFF